MYVEVAGQALAIDATLARLATLRQAHGHPGGVAKEGVTAQRDELQKVVIECAYGCMHTHRHRHA